MCSECSLNQWCLMTLKCKSYTGVSFQRAISALQPVLLCINIVVAGIALSNVSLRERGPIHFEYNPGHKGMTVNVIFTLSMHDSHYSSHYQFWCYFNMLIITQTISYCSYFHFTQYVHFSSLQSMVSDTNVPSLYSTLIDFLSCFYYYCIFYLSCFHTIKRKGLWVCLCYSLILCIQ